MTKDHTRGVKYRSRNAERRSSTFPVVNNNDAVSERHPNRPRAADYKRRHGKAEKRVENMTANTNESKDEIAEEENNTLPETAAEITIIKKGGTYNLPFGGLVTVPAEALSKRGSLFCWQTPSNERYLFEPKLGSDEYLISNVLILETKGRPLQRPIGVQLSHVTIDRDVMDVGVLWRANHSGVNTFWQSTECSPASVTDRVNFIATGEGSYVVISFPRSERFDLPSLGCLYSPRMHRQISIRLPKGAVLSDLQCDMQILRVKEDSLKSISALAEIVAMTDFYRFVTSGAVDFRRTLTIKLPLPAGADKDADKSDIFVLQTAEGSGGGSGGCSYSALTDISRTTGSSVVSAMNNWTILEGPMRLAKNSITFETKFLSKFCVLLAKPAAAIKSMLPRNVRVLDTVRRVEEDNERPRGDILPLVEYLGKTWILWVHCVRQDKIQSIISASPHMTVLHPSSLQAPSSHSHDFLHRPGRLHVPYNRHKDNPTAVELNAELRLGSGSTFQLEISGDLDIAPYVLDSSAGTSDSSGTQYDAGRITYHDALSENYRRFTLVPKSTVNPSDPKVLTCYLRVYRVTSQQQQQQQQQPLHSPIRCFDFDVPSEVVTEFFYVPPPPEVPVLPPTLEKRRRSSAAEAALEKLLGHQTSLYSSTASTAAIAAARRDPKVVAETLSRLTKHVRPPNIVSKEPRVLSGRSLQCVARQMPTAGIKLAVHLDISESTITGMAFDALANGLSASEITYRILMVWKRRAAQFQRSTSSAGAASSASQPAPPDLFESMVRMLSDAVDASGYRHVAKVILRQHRANEELTDECFTSRPPSAGETTVPEDDLG